ncbi:hypothetical protein MBLNU230_g6163t1 [Neophaeotheca triangularis]
MQTKSLLAVALAVIGSTAQDDGSDVDLTTLLAGQESLSSLTELLTSLPDLASELASLEGITIFAPSNDAIAALSDADSVTEEILMYHVVNSEVPSSAVTEDLQFVPTLLEAEVTGGQVVGAQVVDGGVVLTSGLKMESNVVEADLQYNNGIVHIIDSILTVPSSVSEALAYFNLTALADAATTANLVETLDTTSDITVLAPNDEAFAALAGADTSPEELAQVLEFHVLPAVLYSSTILAGDVENAPEGYDIQVTDAGVTINGASVVVADVLVANGVVHVIDAVLDPMADEAPPQSTATGAPYPTGTGAPMPTDTAGEPLPYDGEGAFVRVSMGAAGLAAGVAAVLAAF